MIGGRLFRWRTLSGGSKSMRGGFLPACAVNGLVVVLSLCGAAMGLDGRVLPPTETPVYEDGGDSESRSKAYRAAHPEWDEVFERYMKDMDAFFNRYPGGTPLPPEQASALIDELYHDSGNDRLNWRWQENVLDRITGAALNREISPESAEIFRTGLTEYRKLGGGNAGPLLRMDLALSYCAVSDESHPELQQFVESLAEQSRNEAEQSGSEHARYHVGHRFGQLDYVYSRLERLGRIKPGATEFQRRAACEGALRRLESVDQPDAALIERAAAAVAACGAGNTLNPQRGPGRQVETDPMERLLAAYQKIAERKPGVAKEVIRAIDGRLLWLAQDSGKIDSVRRWDRWADAVAALRFRGSNDLGRFVHRRLKDEKDDEIRGALERAEKGLTSR